MHYYPEDQSDENLKKLIRNNVCSVCGRQLSVYMDFEDPDHRCFLACSGRVHEGIAREYKPPIEDYQSNMRKEAELQEEHGIEGSRALATIPKQGQLTKPQAMTVLNLIYPNATQIEIERCAIFCRDFGLHPLANEVYLIPFKGKNVMVVGIPASRKMAHALKGDFSFLDDTPRAATEEEVVKQYGKDSDEARDNIISVTKLQGVSGNLAIGFGLWPKLREKMAWDGKKMAVVKKDGKVVMESNEPYGTDKGNSKRNMANIHSERQATDRLPGRAMPRVEVIDTKYTVLPEVGKVDTTTGEVVEEPEAEEQPADGEFREVAPEEEAEPELTPEPEASKSIIDLDWLRESLAELQKKGVKGYSDESMLGYMRASYKGVEGDTLYEIASNLNKGQAAHLAKAIQEALDKP